MPDLHKILAENLTHKEWLGLTKKERKLKLKEIVAPLFAGIHPNLESMEKLFVPLKKVNLSKLAPSNKEKKLLKMAEPLLQKAPEKTKEKINSLIKAIAYNKDLEKANVLAFIMPSLVGMLSNDLKKPFQEALLESGVKMESSPNKSPELIRFLIETGAFKTAYLSGFTQMKKTATNLSKKRNLSIEALSKKRQKELENMVQTAFLMDNKGHFQNTNPDSVLLRSIVASAFVRRLPPMQKKVASLIFNRRALNILKTTKTMPFFKNTAELKAFLSHSPILKELFEMYNQGIDSFITELNTAKENPWGILKENKATVLSKKLLNYFLFNKQKK